MTEKESSVLKFQILYEKAIEDYTFEVQRLRNVDEKASKIFTALNILILASITALTRPEYWRYFLEHNIFFQGLELLIIFLFVFYIYESWSKLVSILHGKTIAKIRLDKKIEDIPYDDSKNIEFLYHYLYIAYKKATTANSSFSTSVYEILKLSIYDLQKAFIFLIIFLFFFLLTILKGIFNV